MVVTDFSVFPVLSTPRLLLRSLELEDAEDVFKLRSDPEMMRYIPRPLALDLDDAKKHIEVIKEMIGKNEGINWAITDNAYRNKLMGIIGLYRIDEENSRAEIGYMLLPKYQKKGYIAEAISCILTFAFKEIRFHSIQAHIDPQNYASENVLIKSGFKKEAHLREHEYFDGRFWDTVIYSMLNSEFKTQEFIK